MIRAAGLALLLALSTCGGEDPADGLLDPDFDPDAFENAQAACAKRGGNYQRTGLSQSYVCVEPTRDGGKACSSGNDCDGLCLARSRTCAPIKPLFGCNEVLGGNGAPSTICID